MSSVRGAYVAGSYLQGNGKPKLALFVDLSHRLCSNVETAAFTSIGHLDFSIFFFPLNFLWIKLKGIFVI